MVGRRRVFTFAAIGSCATIGGERGFRAEAWLEAFLGGDTTETRVATGGVVSNLVGPCSRGLDHARLAEGSDAGEQAGRTAMCLPCGCMIFG